MGGPAWDDSTDVVHYGPDVGTETDFRLLGQLEGKRVLALGVAGGHAAIACAKQGAHVIAVDASAEQLADAKRLADGEEVRAEFHQADLADLAFVRADTIDLAFSIFSLHRVEDLNRLFRQVHRVLHTGAAFVFSLPHPAYRVIDDDAEPATVSQSYWDHDPVDGTEGPEYPRTISDLVTGLTRANFTVDAVLEPEPPPSGHRSSAWRAAFRLLPSTLIMRARKEGI